MKFQKTATILIATLLLVSIVATLVTLPAQAQKSGEMASYAYLSVEPNPVGVGQTTYIAMWIDFPMPGATEANSVRRHDYKLTITAPDGSTETKTWAEVKDTTGVQSTSFTPDQAGNYTFFFEYPKQNYTWTTTQGGSAAYAGVWFLTANATATLKVLEETINGAIDVALPSEYWSRPIYGTNDNWYTIASHWLGSNYFGTFQQGGYNLWQTVGSAPSSSHIAWTLPFESGGVVGGTDTYTDGATYYSGGSYQGRFQNSIIIDGKLYTKGTIGDSNTAGTYMCIDLRTGKILWTNDNINPTFGELYAYESVNQHGVIPNGYLWQTVAQGTGIQTWIAWDAETGKWAFNLTDVPSSGTIVYTQNGEI
ncbi:MAG TPA: hypothetical protein VLH35_06545, partial [Candidatus Acidoferrales bacterium]|nr:hypothetical protein [Candidatus Acidoferrales bacterium]